MYNIKCKFTAYKYKFQIGFVKTFAARQNTCWKQKYMSYFDTTTTSMLFLAHRNVT
jgi:hypothetical protein